MSWLDGKHLTTPGTRTYWIINMALTCGGMTSPDNWQANTPAELARMLRVVEQRTDLELVAVYRHELTITEVAPLTAEEVAALGR